MLVNELETMHANFVEALTIIGSKKVKNLKMKFMREYIQSCMVIFMTL